MHLINWALLTPEKFIAIGAIMFFMVALFYLGTELGSGDSATAPVISSVS